MSSTTKQLSLIHLTRKPKEPAPEGTTSPLLILLHGVGSNEYDLFGLAEYLDPRFFVVSVRSPLTIGPGAYGWYPVIFTPDGAVGDTRQVEAGRQKLIQFIREATEAYSVDSERVYLLGFSQGAIMSLFVTLTHPELMAGTIAMSGRLLPEAWEKRVDDASLTGKPIIAVHGTRDPILPISEGREIHAKLSTLPVDLTYKEYNMAHEVSQQSLNDIAAWVKATLDR